MVTPDQIHVPLAVLRGIQLRESIIAQHQHVVIALQAEMQAYISSQLGVDLSTADWKLDPQQGILERVNVQSTPQPEIGVQLPQAASTGHEGTEGSGSGPTGEPSQA